MINENVYILCFDRVKYIFDRENNKYKKQTSFPGKCGLIEDSSKEEFDKAIKQSQEVSV